MVELPKTFIAWLAAVSIPISAAALLWLGAFVRDEVVFAGDLAAAVEPLQKTEAVLASEQKQQGKTLTGILALQLRKEIRELQDELSRTRDRSVREKLQDALSKAETELAAL